ncbi:DUF6708 domain-containing protein [Paraburkholderia pallida]|uniref:DUF6708 domain-containing protein n=1 Tax=Paraburkholderia pallida TaxID=2547399 RepID=A0A4P7CVC0_9BURK|nr:DUF6708 domain-containing protein [Paraburkholderia pallida]QBR00091.1 hypothetical protein E1956_23670 [Paraburkholderia pallida]
MFEGFTRYQLNRPLTDEEKAARLPTGEPCSATPKDGFTAFSISESCLEISDARFRDKGYGLLAFLLPGMASLAGILLILWMMTHMPPIYAERGETGIVYGGLSFCLVIFMGLFGVGVWAMMRDCFGYTRYPIRLSRQNQMIYAFRHNGPGGLVSVPWDKAFFYVERRAKAGAARTASRLVRCLVLSDSGQVIDTFSLGKRVVLAFEEDSEVGQQVMGEFYSFFEYYRRFMADGASAVPPITQFLPTKISLRNSLKMQFEDVSDIVNSPNPALWLLFALTAIPSVIQGCLNYLAQLTCREPVWPEDVERACNAAPRTTKRLAT